ncbi:putative glycolipid-binding domain-containing protein [Crenobacter cavernae]|uniref:Glycolipid-binding domain-containing protein n=1 Tax=Crenobacter cavernae TaxID=2290923 RepID=A0ABY0FDL5_9NEIS|nr:putative glycolipid-binding domain-containing protein [Crenobacter cavernae]RXZ44275.1 hypothetical protein EBB06_06990 [Crenobacter cavernae]
MPAVHYRWRQDGAAGREEIHASFSADAPRWQGKSRIEQPGILLDYKIETDAAGVFRHAVFTLAEPCRRTMTIERLAGGEWLINGKPRPEFSACTDIDVMDSGLTNTLAIRRLGLEPGGSAELSVLFLPLPSLEPFVAPQRYTHLDDGKDGRPRYRYDGLDSDFTAVITVDAQGFVLGYPGVLRLDSTEP